MTQALKEAVGRITEILKTTNWVKCPMCAMEWTKLRPCPFFSGESKEWESVCVECAESLKSFSRISKMFPIKKVFENWAEDWVLVQQRSPIVLEKTSMPKTITATIKVFIGSKDNGIPVFDWFLYPEGTGIVLYDAKEKTIIEKYDNTFQAWLASKKRIENWAKEFQESEKKQTKSWGFQKMRCFAFWI